MISLRKTLYTAHKALTDAGIDHALIGGFALAYLGVNRATSDIDFIAEGDKRDIIKTSLKESGFVLTQETEEVLHFDSQGFLDILLAKRPLSQQMLKDAKVLDTGIKCLGPEDIIGLKIQAYMNNSKRALQDKADIKALLEKNSNLDWNRIRKYADLFNQWNEIQRIRDL